MFVPRLRAFAAPIALGALTAIAACSGSHAAGTSAPPPSAEFLISSADSTFWITTTNGVIHVRGAPLVLARFDERFYELYTAEDDRSYADALLVGERLYRRDLLSGDSLMVFSDTTVAHVAEIYARTHPDERPLAPDEEGNSDPQTSATAELDILDVFGPFLSYEYHVDIGLPRRTPWHSTRRGVLDLRTGKRTLVGDLVGAEQAARIVAAARKTYESVRDSAVRARQALTDAERRALTTLERRQFDPSCFALESVDGQPAITFAVPGGGEGTAGNLVELDPVPLDSLDWWRSVRPTLAVADSADDDRWAGLGYTVLARYDTSGQIARLSLSDSSRREWPLGTVTGPLQRIAWLDHPAPSAAERAALRRAFDAAANYGENARVALAAEPNLRHTQARRSSERRARKLTFVQFARHTLR